MVLKEWGTVGSEFLYSSDVNTNFQVAMDAALDAAFKADVVGGVQDQEVANSVTGPVLSPYNLIISESFNELWDQATLTNLTGETGYVINNDIDTDVTNATYQSPTFQSPISVSSAYSHIDYTVLDEFDFFNDSSFDGTKWTDTGTITENASGYIEIGAGEDCTSDGASGLDMVGTHQYIYTRVNSQSDGDMRIQLTDGSTSINMFVVPTDSTQRNVLIEVDDLISNKARISIDGATWVDWVDISSLSGNVYLKFVGGAGPSLVYFVFKQQGTPTSTIAPAVTADAGANWTATSSRTVTTGLTAGQKIAQRLVFTTANNEIILLRRFCTVFN